MPSGRSEVMERWRRSEERLQPAFRRGAAAAPWRTRSTTTTSHPSPSSSHTHRPTLQRQRSPIARRSPNAATTEPSSDGPDEGPRESDGGAALVGTCPDMCPAKERSQRERLRDLSFFERLDGDSGRTSPSLAVKKFSRTISTTQWHASDIRPLPVLQETLSYLLSLLCYSDHPFEVVHDFLFDRTRSIRQDITIQKLSNDEAMNLYEEMVKFHITSHQRLLRINDKVGTSSLIHLNTEQLIKCLMTLYDMYASKNRTNALRKNEAEFYSFYVLLHLGQNHQTLGNSLSLWYRKLASPVLQSKQMHFARAALRYFQMGNYVRFFRLISSEASDLQLCLMESVVNEVRSRAILYVNNSGYKLHPYPLRHLSNLLLLKESDLESLCSSCGLEVKTDEKTHCKFLPTKQMNFCLPKNSSEHYTFIGSENLERWQNMCMDVRNLLGFN